MPKLLSYRKTKMELTEFLSENVLIHTSKHDGRRLVVAWGSYCKARHKDVTHLKSSQEEADTKMLLHAVENNNKLYGSSFYGNLSKFSSKCHVMFQKKIVTTPSAGGCV